VTETRRVTVVVVTYRSAAYVPALFDSLAAGMRGLAYDVVVADNRSTDGTVALVRAAAPEAVVLDLPNRGYAAAINAAIAAAPARSDAVLVLNPDLVLRPDCGRLLAGAFAASGAVGIVGPRIDDGEGALVFSQRRDPSVSRALGEALLGGTRARRFARGSEVVGVPEAYDHATEVDWVSGAALMISRACLDAVGPWDESFFLYSEESEYAQRARRTGFTVRYEPAARVVHAGGEMHANPDLWALCTTNRLRLFARTHGRVATGAFRAALVLNEGLRSASRVHRAALRALCSRDALTPGAGYPRRAARRGG
jgi:GT2 family glycosyltransferase